MSTTTEEAENKPKERPQKKQWKSPVFEKLMPDIEMMSDAEKNNPRGLFE